MNWSGKMERLPDITKTSPIGDKPVSPVKLKAIRRSGVPNICNSIGIIRNEGRRIDRNRSDRIIINYEIGKKVQKGWNGSNRHRKSRRKADQLNNNKKVITCPKIAKHIQKYKKITPKITCNSNNLGLKNENAMQCNVKNYIQEFYQNRDLQSGSKIFNKKEEPFGANFKQDNSYITDRNAYLDNIINKENNREIYEPIYKDLDLDKNNEKALFNIHSNQDNNRSIIDTNINLDNYKITEKFNRDEAMPYLKYKDLYLENKNNNRKNNDEGLFNINGKQTNRYITDNNITTGHMNKIIDEVMVYLKYKDLYLENINNNRKSNSDESDLEILQDDGNDEINKDNSGNLSNAESQLDNDNVEETNNEVVNEIGKVKSSQEYLTGSKKDDQHLSIEDSLFVEAVLNSIQDVKSKQNLKAQFSLAYKL